VESIDRDEKHVFGLRIFGAGRLSCDEQTGHQADRSQPAEDTNAKSGHEMPPWLPA
jgi:hypothetical protein